MQDARRRTRGDRERKGAHEAARVVVARAWTHGRRAIAVRGAPHVMPHQAEAHQRDPRHLPRRLLPARRALRKPQHGVPRSVTRTGREGRARWPTRPKPHAQGTRAPDARAARRIRTTPRISRTRTARRQARAAAGSAGASAARAVGGAAASTATASAAAARAAALAPGKAAADKTCAAVTPPAPPNCRKFSRSCSGRAGAPAQRTCLGLYSELRYS